MRLCGRAWPRESVGTWCKNAIVVPVSISLVDANTVVGHCRECTTSSGPGCASPRNVLENVDAESETVSDESRIRPKRQILPFSFFFSW